MRIASPRLIVGKDTTEFVHALERHARAAHDARQRVFGDEHGQAGFFREQTVEIAQQRTTASKHDAAFGDVGAEFRRRVFERDLHRRYNPVQRIGERFQDLVARDREAARYDTGKPAPVAAAMGSSIR